MATITNPTIQAALDAYLAKQVPAPDAGKLAAMASDVSDWAQALALAGLTFNAKGLCVKKGKIFWEGVETPGGGAFQAKVSAALGADMAGLVQDLSREIL